jgi:hypothetical protein
MARRHEGTSLRRVQPSPPSAAAMRGELLGFLASWAMRLRCSAQRFFVPQRYACARRGSGRAYSAAFGSGGAAGEEAGLPFSLACISRILFDPLFLDLIPGPMPSVRC